MSNKLISRAVHNLVTNQIHLIKIHDLLISLHVDASPCILCRVYHHLLCLILDYSRNHHDTRHVIYCFCPSGAEIKSDSGFIKNTTIV